MQATLIGYAPSGQSWVGWVVLAVIVSFMAVSFFGIVRGRLRNGMIEWRSRRQLSSPPTSGSSAQSGREGWTRDSELPRESESG